MSHFIPNFVRDEFTAQQFLDNVEKFFSLPIRAAGAIASKVDGLDKVAKVVKSSFEFLSASFQQIKVDFPFPAILALNGQLKTLVGVISGLQIFNRVYEWVGPNPFWMAETEEGKDKAGLYTKIVSKIFLTVAQTIDFLKMLDSFALISLGKMAAVSIGRLPVLNLVKDGLITLSSGFDFVSQSIAVFVEGKKKDFYGKVKRPAFLTHWIKMRRKRQQATEQHRAYRLQTNRENLLAKIVLPSLPEKASGFTKKAYNTAVSDVREYITGNSSEDVLKTLLSEELARIRANDNENHIDRDEGAQQTEAEQNVEKALVAEFKTVWKQAKRQLKQAKSITKLEEKIARKCERKANYYEQKIRAAIVGTDEEKNGLSQGIENYIEAQKRYWRKLRELSGNNLNAFRQGYAEAIRQRLSESVIVDGDPDDSVISEIEGMLESLDFEVLKEHPDLQRLIEKHVKWSVQIVPDAGDAKKAKLVDGLNTYTGYKFKNAVGKKQAEQRRLEAEKSAIEAKLGDVANPLKKKEIKKLQKQDAWFNKEIATTTNLINTMEAIESARQEILFVKHQRSVYEVHEANTFRKLGKCGIAMTYDVFKVSIIAAGTLSIATGVGVFAVLGLGLVTNGIGCAKFLLDELYFSEVVSAPILAKPVPAKAA